MDYHRIDAVARILAGKRSRRSALGGVLGLAGAIAPFAAARSTAQEATPPAGVEAATDPNPGADAPAKSEFLFVQPFQAGTWAPKAGEENVYTLTLSGAAAQTVYFSDRPEREFGLAPTRTFLDGLGFTPANPPNAALVAQGADGGDQEVLVIELLSPAYDDAAGTLTYDARMLADYDEPGLAHAARQQADFTLPETFAEGGLFIDDCSDRIHTCLRDGQVVGTVTVGYCWDWTCDPCHDPKSICGEHFGACVNKVGCAFSPEGCQYLCDTVEGGCKSSGSAIQECD